MTLQQCYNTAMNTEYTFQAVIVDAGGGGAFVRIPFDVEKTFGKKRVPISALIEGIPYRGTLVRMGEPHHILIILKEIRNAIGKGIGDTIEIRLHEDTKPRVIEIPEDLQNAFENAPRAWRAFNQLSYSHKKEHVLAILEAKRDDTRKKRITKTIQILQDTKKDS
jgi:hypothetical protein